MPRPDRAVAQSFDRTARTFVRMQELGGDGIGDWLRGVLPGGRRAVELGAGAGRHATLVAERYDEVLAVDTSAAMLALAPAHDRVTYVQRDLAEVSGQFDLVLTVNTLHHCDDIRGAVAHIGSLVAPGGTAVVVDCVRGLPPLLWNRLTLRLFPVIDLARDVVSRAPYAWERYRLQNHGPWIDHLATDRFPSRAEWEAIYRDALPGARVEPVAGFLAATWVRSSLPS